MRADTRIRVTAEEFDLVREAYCADRMAEHIGTKPFSAKSTLYGGYRYTVFGVMYRPWSVTEKPEAWAYRLVPESMYEGKTMMLHEYEQAVREGSCERGDQRGLIVKVKGQMMVCAEAVTFEQGLPAARPICLEEAKAFDKESQAYGWRAHFYKGQEPEWYSYSGHPVSVYWAEDGDRAATLFWRHGEQIVEMRLDDDIELSGLDALMPAAPPQPGVRAEQMALF